MANEHTHIRWRWAVLGFAGALGVFVVLFFFIDLDRVITTLGRADLSVIGLMVVGALGWLLAWSLSLRTVLFVFDTELSIHRSFLAYASALFSDNITPFGQAGGEPVAAVFISRISKIRYETALASIASVDAINFVPSITLALLGFVYLTLFRTVDTDLMPEVVVIGSLALVVPTVLYLSWRFRSLLGDSVLAVLNGALGLLGRFIPGVPLPDSVQLQEYIENFFHSIERIAHDRRRISIALSFSALGWLAQIIVLWLSFASLGYRIPFGIALIVVPLGAIASVVPLPGGLGAIDAALIGLLTSLTTVNLAAVTAAVVLFRGLIYGLPTIIGASTITLVSLRWSILN